MSELANVMEKTAKGIMADIRSDRSKHKRPEGNAEIDFQIVKDDYDVVRGEYTAQGQKMWILEHGSGSKMDDEKENPDLPDYKRSELWNKERGKPPGNDESSNEIRSRGPYYDLDGNFHEGASIATFNWMFQTESSDGQKYQVDIYARRVRCDGKFDKETARDKASTPQLTVNILDPGDGHDDFAVITISKMKD